MGLLAMRADRLLSLMMLLQKRKVLTAQQLAEELEVSMRTIYRDIDALSVAGVPVYAHGGPGGGYELLDDYRTSLTGLNDKEIQALFGLTVPGPIADLGINQQLKTAVLKLTSTFTEGQNQQINYLRHRLHLDAAGWFQSDEPIPHLKTLQNAVWQNMKLVLSYRRQETMSERLVSPLGLVAKASVWYLVAENEKRVRVYRVSNIEDAQITDVDFERPEDFDLGKFWNEFVDDYKNNLPKYPVTIRIHPDMFGFLPSILGKNTKILLNNAPPDSHGWRTIDYSFERMEEAQSYILGMGAAVEVIAPKKLRDRVLDLAKNVVEFYSVDRR